MTTMSEVLEYLVDMRAAALKPKSLAELFDQMIWLTDDNGGAIHEVRRQWLEGNDPLRVEVALLMSEAFPFGARPDMEKVFNNICNRWPEFRALCVKILDDWDKQFGKP
jgi:hypothetical protein